MVGNNNSQNDCYEKILKMTVMKKIISIIKPFFLFLVFSIAGGQSIIANNTQDDLPIHSGQF